MERENRYLVLKLTDLGNYLDVNELDCLDRLVCKVEAGRRRRNAEPNIQCVVVEHDWPEFEKVWDMIEARVDGKVLRYKTENVYQDLPDLMPDSGGFDTSEDKDWFIGDDGEGSEEVSAGKCIIVGDANTTFSMEQIKTLCDGLSEFSGRFDVQVIDPNGHEPEPDTVDD